MSDTTTTQPQQRQLTQEHIDKLPAFREKWLRVGANTERTTIAEMYPAANLFNRRILDATEDIPVLLVDSPIDAWDIVCAVAHEKRLDLLDVLKQNPTDEAVQKHVAEIWLAESKSCLLPFVWPWLAGSLDASLYAYYDFWANEFDVGVDQKCKDNLEAWKGLQRGGVSYPLQNIWVMSQPPITYHRNERGLHCETGPACEYPCGFKLYSLHGVQVPEYLVMTPSEDLDINWYLKETNADVKAEFVRKYGIERMLNLGKLVESYTKYDKEQYPWYHKSQYELWDMESLFPWLEYQPYLKMQNQTTGIWHVEACSPNCRTIEDAIKERCLGRDVSIKSIS